METTLRHVEYTLNLSYEENPPEILKKLLPIHLEQKVLFVTKLLPTSLTEMTCYQYQYKAYPSN